MVCADVVLVSDDREDLAAQRETIRFELDGVRGLRAPDHGHFSVTEIEAQEQRRAVATHLIDNSGDLAHLEAQVDDVWADLLKKKDAPEPETPESAPESS